MPPLAVTPAAAYDRAPVADPRAQRRLRRVIGLIGAAVVPLGVAGILLGIGLNDPAVLASGFGELASGIWLLLEYQTSRHRPAGTLAVRAALAMDLSIIAGVTAEPTFGIAGAMAAVIPPVVALIHVPRRTVLWLML